MKKITLLFSLSFILSAFVTSCDADDILDAITANYEDTKEAFDEIASRTDGFSVGAEDSDELVERIIDLTEADNGRTQSGADVVFLIDKTGSMDNDIDTVEESITTIIDQLPTGTQIALGTYGDINVDGSEWYSLTALVDAATQGDTIKTALAAIETTGGGDWEESVYDALYKTMESTSWTSTAQRVIILIADAGPLTDSDETTYTLDDIAEKSAASDPQIQVFTITVKNS